MAPIVNPRSLAQLICASCGAGLEVPIRELLEEPLICCAHCGTQIRAHRLAALLKSVEREFADIARQRKDTSCDMGLPSNQTRQPSGTPGRREMVETDCLYVRYGWKTEEDIS